MPLSRLAAAGLTRHQVRVACVKTATPFPTDCISPDGTARGDAGVLAAQYAAISRNLKLVFPNIELTYFLSRTYGGLRGYRLESGAVRLRVGFRGEMDAGVADQRDG